MLSDKVKNGRVEIDLDYELSVGEYNISAIYNENDEYMTGKGNGSLTVSNGKVYTYQDLEENVLYPCSFQYGGETMYYIQFIDGSNKLPASYTNLYDGEYDYYAMINLPHMDDENTVIYNYESEAILINGIIPVLAVPSGTIFGSGFTLNDEKYDDVIVSDLTVVTLPNEGGGATRLTSNIPSGGVVA